MRSGGLLPRTNQAIFALSALFLGAALSASAQTGSVLFSFSGDANGSHPLAGLVQGADNNFYGTTSNGTTHNRGTIFKITTGGSLSTLITFDGTNGGSPQSTMVIGKDHNFYGATYGLANDFASNTEYGTVFQLTPTGTFSTIVYFALGNLTDGSAPQGTLAAGNDGNIYGTTYGGGSHGFGTFFRTTPGGTLTTLASFGGQTTGQGGILPQGGVIQGSDGNFYGTTSSGGAGTSGTVFQATSSVGTSLSPVASFSGANGSTPYSRLIEDSQGNFYGTTSTGGAHGFGNVFMISPQGVLTTLYDFTGGSDVGNPQTGVIEDSLGNLYGTTPSTLYKITPAGVFSTLLQFDPTTIGSYPNELTLGHDGNIYGTCDNGGANSAGTVFCVNLGADLFGGTNSGPNMNYSPWFGYYTIDSYPLVYEYNLGYEYAFDAGGGAVYLYDYASGHFWYTQGGYFPFVFDFTLNTYLYYYPGNGNPRYFYNYNTGKIISE